MNLLTIAGIKESLEYIRDNSNVVYHKNGPRKGFIVTPDGATPEQGYSLFLVQKFTPKLIVQHLENLTVLTLEGQELLDILSDDTYLGKIVEDLKTIGYTNPSDRQIFREVRRRMEITDFGPPVPTHGHKELFRDFFHAAYEASKTGITVTNVTDGSDVQLTETTQVEVIEEKFNQPEIILPALVVEVPEKVDVVETEEVVDAGGVGSSLVSSGPKINVQGHRNDKQRKGRN